MTESKDSPEELLYSSENKSSVHPRVNVPTELRWTVVSSSAQGDASNFLPGLGAQGDATSSDHYVLH